MSNTPFTRSNAEGLQSTYFLRKFVGRLPDHPGFDRQDVVGGEPFTMLGSIDYLVEVSDSVTAADTAVVSQGFVRDFSDSATPADTTAFSITKGVSDSATPADATAFDQTKAFDDTVTPADTVAANETEVIDDTVTVTDAVTMTRTVTLNLSDTVTVTDSVQTASLTLTQPTSPTGFLEGGETFILSGTALDMSGLQDDFNDGSVTSGGFWATAHAGSGGAIEVPNADTNLSGTVQLDTGTTASSIARIRTTATETHCDVGATFAPTAVFGLSALSMGLGLYVSSTTFLRMRLHWTNQGTTPQVSATLDARTDGASCYLGAVDLSAVRVDARGGVDLRLLRSGATVRVFVNGVLVRTVIWTATAAVVELSAENAGTNTRLVVGARNYRRVPIVLFGTEPAVDVRMSGQKRVYGTVPPGNEGAVTMSVVSFVGPRDFTDPWVYTVNPDLLGLRAGGAALTVLNDPRLRV